MRRRQMGEHRMLFLLGLFTLTAIAIGACASPDCEWNATVKTWVDNNRDGEWDANEPPLANVRAYVEGSYSVGVGEATTGQSGEAHLTTMLAGCPNEAVLSVFVEPPVGYRLTTQERLPAKTGSEKLFLFGFVSIAD